MIKSLVTAVHFIIPAAIGVILLFPGIVEAKKESDKAGYIERDTYFDNRFGFSFRIPSGWRTSKIQKEPTAERILLTQRSYRIPVKLQHDRGAAQRPTVIICADSTRQTPEEFFRELRTAEKPSPFAEKVITRSVFLQRGSQHPLEVMETREENVGGFPAVRYRLWMEYTVPVEDARLGTTGLIRDRKAGNIYLVPFEGWMLYIEQVAENQFFDSLSDDFNLIINSLTFGDEKGFPAAGKAAPEEDKE